MSSRSVLLALVFLLAAAPPPTAPAAELRVSDGEVVVEDGVAYVEVDVSWRLSWRNDTNWDAAWLTVKAPVGREGVPLKLAPTGHRVVDTRTPDQSGPTFSVSDDSVGTFVYRDAQADGRGPNDWTLRLRLVLPEGATPADLPEPLLVHGVEMVYVPEGPFSVGDPQRPENAPANAFYEQTADTTAFPPYRITDSGAIRMCDGPGSLCYPRLDNPYDSLRVGDFQGPIPVSYPNGYDAFYLMKYEVTQGQYAEFLNVLKGNQTAERTPPRARKYHWNRGAISLAGDEYVAARPDRACNYLSWADAAAYADWAGLRPMTELEYEKAARGPAAPVPNEFTWGSATIAHGDTIFAADTTIARSEGGDTFVRGNANYTPAGVNWNGGYNATFTGGDEGVGPLRVDIFETRAHRTGGASMPDASLREASGAGYYGAHGLSGSLFDRVVTVGDPTGRRFRGTHGDGDLSYPASASNEDWPPMNGDGLGLRGGTRSDGPPGLRSATREWGDYGAHYRAPGMGVRAARTAP
ncbi:SUMF1/EgtB/PvdO family nonheme iron enzyme [Salinibacter ruber]|jgi:formylglycine-generating enzyme required for sulfatase activity|uniref:Formylglycine-generating enzyme required for sulfatase activity n=1 Tax=Salinibacter ruber TaxID=146919 RepID=A0A9X2U4W0_9BACT|nr:SUMF1/EgtB/PvdO family nonheme iron enzyme [Salinibacter ruber]MCS3860042.1 formylglycine-generating enzyme required for sulfatase activity [Salinibacter ruber]MCS3866870.1 formylglycine-generating enzyme required for sulfatase activity [Salinibacter ruber]MCS4054197.1 formylglycine-generating enzyme required for sulfatase activity [Salinibacter ruber]